MRHYEVVYLVHPNESELLETLLEKHQTIINEGKGQVHRLENWGRREMAYSINNVHKAFYVLMNIECTLETLKSIEGTFQFNDHILRNLIIKRPNAITEKSFMVINAELEQAKKDTVETT